MKNPRRPEIEGVVTQAMVDTGCTHLCIPESLRHQLGLDVLEQQIIRLADDSRISVPYVGPIELRFKNRTGFSGAFVMGTSVVIGLIAMEDMDLVILPRTQMLDVNPLSPDCASGMAMGIRHSHPA